MPPANGSGERARVAFDGSLKRLGLDYVDLYLMHWPCSTEPDTDLKKHYSDWDYIKTWIEMQKLAGTGKVRNLTETLMNTYADEVRGVAIVSA